MKLTQERILINFPSFLIVLLPVFLISGPFLSDLSVVIVGIFFLINIILKKEYYFLKNKFIIIFFIFSLYLFINSLINYYDFHSIRSSLGYLRFGIFSLGVFYFLEKRSEIIKWLFLSFMVCYLLLIFDGYYQYFNKVSFFLRNEPQVGGRISSLFGSELIMGSYLSRLFPIFLGITFFLFKEKKEILLIISTIFILIEVLIFLSGERASFFFNTLAAIYIIIMIKDFKKIRLFSFLTSIVLIFFITNIDNTAKKRIVDETIFQMGLNDEKKYIFSPVHQSHYLSAYKMFLDNKVLGIGVRNFRNFCNEDKYKVAERSCTTHPHNTYVQLLSETGLIGFIFFVSIFIFFIIISLKHLLGVITKNKYYFNDFEICMLSAILISLWPFVPTGNFLNNWVSIVYYYPVGFLLWSLNKRAIIT
tara:strand:- start:100 stop:1356 length:1257 start_codon:yes stop_codon:yes gene_type:complete